QWQMLSNFSANYLNFADERSLKQLLRSYNVAAKVDRQTAREMNNVLDSIVEIDMQSTMKLISGIPIQGYKIVMIVHGDLYSNEGDMYLFFTVLAKYFSQLTNINSFSLLEVHDIDCGEVHSWDCNVSGLIV
ncbi:MAG: type VI secretion system baseplate subunit TssF, partial [Thiohalomonadales bacterium]